MTAGNEAPPARRLPRPARLALGLLVGWVLVAGVLLGVAAVSLQRGERAVRAADADRSVDAVVSGRLAERLESADRHFTRGSTLLASPPVVPLRLLPIAGRQLRAVTAMAVSAREGSRAGRDVVLAATTLLDDPADSGRERLEAIDVLGRALEDATGRLGGVDLGPDEALVGPVASRRASAAEQLEEVRDLIGRASRAADGLASLLRGPRRYLLLTANNAEMRAGSGMFLAAGVAEFRDGEVEVGDMTPTGDLLLAADEAPGLTGDLAARWGWLEPNREWRNLALSPRFESSASVALDMWEARTGERLDGVVVLDVIAIRELLAATGPVEVGDRAFSEDDVVEYLFFGQYEGLGAQPTDAVQDARRDVLGSLAGAVLSRLTGGGVDLSRLAEGLAGAVGGRHLMVWAADDVEQAAWEGLDAHGALTPDSLAVAILNRGGNKVDQFLDVAVDVSVETAAAGGARTLELRIEVTNDAPEGDPSYVLGPQPGLSTVAGEYVGLVAVSLPGDSRSASFVGLDTLAVAGADGPTTVLATPISLRPGASTVLVARAGLPPERSIVVVEPGARVPPTRFQYQGAEWTDAHRRRVDVAG